jgi:hypothetical protein
MDLKTLPIATNTHATLEKLPDAGFLYAVRIVPSTHYVVKAK